MSQIRGKPEKKLEILGQWDEVRCVRACGIMNVVMYCVGTVVLGSSENFYKI